MKSPWDSKTRAKLGKPNAIKPLDYSVYADLMLVSICLLTMFLDLLRSALKVYHGT